MAQVGAPPLDVTRLRADFPILSQTTRSGHPLVYLDNAATSQKPRQVIDAVARFYGNDNANIHRGVHYLSEQATEAYEAVRARLARFVGAESPSEIVFTRGTTEAINLAVHTWARRALREGDEILLTEMEHHSNLVPWQLLARRTGARLRYLEMDSHGRLRLEDLPSLLGGKLGRDQRAAGLAGFDDNDRQR